jgi:hypothetical protein
LVVQPEKGLEAACRRTGRNIERPQMSLKLVTFTFLVAPVLLAVGAVVAWAVSGSGRWLHATRALRIGAVALGILSVPTATLSYMGLGLSADFDRAFAGEDFAQEELARRLVATDRWMALIAVSGVAGALTAVRALVAIKLNR